MDVLWADLLNLKGALQNFLVVDQPLFDFEVLYLVLKHLLGLLH